MATGRFLHADPFTLSADGRPWIDLHWLFQLWAYGLYRLGGLAAVVIGKAALVVAGAQVLLGATFRAGGADPPRSLRPLFVVALAAGLYFARHLLLARPVVFTLVFLALFIWMLEDARGRSWWLPVLQIVWVNSQGLFLLGPAVVACYLGGAAWSRWRGASVQTPAPRRLLLVLGACLLACLATPYGLDGLVLPARLLARIVPAGDDLFSREIAENVPPLLLARVSPEQVAHFGFALALVLASFALAPRPLHVGRLLLVGAFGALALTANRNVLLFYWVAAPAVALNLAAALERLRARAPAPLATACTFAPHAPLLALTALVARAHAAETPIAQPAPFRVPAGAVAHLAALPTRSGGRVFTADHMGGYVTFALHPRFRPFIDTRLVLHTADEYRDFLGLLDHPARFAAFQRRERFDHVILPTAFPDRYLGLVQHLAAAPDWRLVYTDGSEVLFSRADATAAGMDLGDDATLSRVLAALDARTSVTTAVGQAARHHLARLLLLTGHLPQAHTVLDRLPDADLGAQALRARAHLLGGSLDAAEAAAQRLLAADGESPAALTLFATIALARGDGAAALLWLRRSLAADPYDAEATALLARLEATRQGHIEPPR